MTFTHDLRNFMHFALILTSNDRLIYIQDHIQGGPKKLAHFVLYALT